MKTCWLSVIFIFGFVSSVVSQDGVIPTPEETVRVLYEGHLANGSALSGQRDDPSWQFRFDKDLLKVLRSKHWNFDPLWFAQDEDVKEVQVRLIDENGRGGSLVLVSFVNFGEPMRLIVCLNHTDHGHQIVNIVDPKSGTSLLRDLAPEAE